MPAPHLLLETSDALASAGGGVLLPLLNLAGLALLVVAALLLIRDRDRRSIKATALWLVLIVVVPFIGPAVFLYVRSRSARGR